MDGGTVRAVPLIVRFWYKVCFTDLALLSACRLHDLSKQFLVCWKDCVFEIVAVDPVPADALHAGMLLAVIQQKAITVHIIATKLFDESVDPL